jgi:hypothetical protein
MENTQNNDREKFENDLIGGQNGERAVAEFLEDHFGWNWIYFNDSKDKQKLKEFDFYMYDGSHKSVEVKTDRYETFHGETGNMLIEFSCSGKPSGINATKADLFIYYYPDHELAYIIETEKLRKLIKTHHGFAYHIATAGDGLKTKCYFVNRFASGHHFLTVRVPREYWEKSNQKSMNIVGAEKKSLSL